MSTELPVPRRYVYQRTQTTSAFARGQESGSGRLSLTSTNYLGCTHTRREFRIAGAHGDAWLSLSSKGITAQVRFAAGPVHEPAAGGWCWWCRRPWCTAYVARDAQRGCCEQDDSSRLLQLAHRFCDLLHLGCHGSLPREHGLDPLSELVQPQAHRLHLRRSPRRARGREIARGRENDHVHLGWSA